MKHFILAAGALLLAAASAHANNSTVEDALKSRENLSIFYQALMNSGVAAELESGKSYTVFAPTNEAFAEITAEKYPCFYSPDCKEEVADIVRNHIVEGNYYLPDVASRGGLHSLDKLLIRINEATTDDFFIAGKHVETTNMLLGGMLYQLDGVIAEEMELARLEGPRMPMRDPQLTAEPESAPPAPTLTPAR